DGLIVSNGFSYTSKNVDEYSQLRMIENHWELPTLSYDAQAPIMTDILGTGSPGVTVSNPPSTLAFLYIGLIAGAAVSLSVILVKYHSRNRKLSATLNKGRRNQSRTDSA